MAGHTEAANRFAMFRRRVADIGFPTVDRVARRESAHDPVAGHLGDDRGRGDREAEGIALDDGLHGTGQRRGDAAVDKGDIRRHPEQRHRPRHRQQGGAQNIDAVNFDDARRGHPDTRGSAIDAALQRPEAHLALLDAQRFRIVQPGAQRLREAASVEDHGSCDYRPGERATPGFVDPADQPRAALLDPEIRHPFSPGGLCHKGAGRATRWQRFAGWVAGFAIVLLVTTTSAAAFDLFGTRHEVTVQFATADGKPLANAEVRVFAPGEPKVPAETGRTDSEGKFLFEADRDGFWSAEARGADQVAHLMIRVGGGSQSQSRLSPLLVIGVIAIMVAVAIWYGLLRARARRPKGPANPPANRE
jgi:hypothetical protein